MVFILHVQVLTTVRSLETSDTSTYLGCPLFLSAETGRDIQCTHARGHEGTYSFAFADVFDNNDNDAVHGETVHNLVLAAIEGGVGTKLMYGQANSGKAFILSAIYVRAAVYLFANTGDRVVTVSFMELFGDQIFDMLNGGAPCQCMTSTDGVASPYSCVEVQKDAKELLLTQKGTCPPCLLEDDQIISTVCTRSCRRIVQCFCLTLNSVIN